MAQTTSDWIIKSDKTNMQAATIVKKKKKKLKL